MTLPSSVRLSSFSSKVFPFSFYHDDRRCYTSALNPLFQPLHWQLMVCWIYSLGLREFHALCFVYMIQNPKLNFLCIGNLHVQY